ncbi:MAG: hypothetical protein AAF310_03410 [Myxococcota bacterium]
MAQKNSGAILGAMRGVFIKTEEKPLYGYLWVVGCFHGLAAPKILLSKTSIIDNKRLSYHCCCK